MFGVFWRSLPSLTRYHAYFPYQVSSVCGFFPEVTLVSFFLSFFLWPSALTNTGNRMSIYV